MKACDGISFVVALALLALIPVQPSCLSNTATSSARPRICHSLLGWPMESKLNTPLRLRGGELVNLMPETPELPDTYDEVFTCPEAEEILAKAEAQMDSGDYVEARVLRKRAVDKMIEHGAASKHMDRLQALLNRIDDAERVVNETLAETAPAPPPPFWTVSQQLNLTKFQVDALESWTGKALKTENVLYLASKEGYDSRIFHRNCDNKGPTVTIVRTGTGHIFGGYTSVSWTKGTLAFRPPRWDPVLVDDPNAFIFRLAAPVNYSAPDWSAVQGGGYTFEEMSELTLRAMNLSEGFVNVSYRNATPDGPQAAAYHGEDQMSDSESRQGLSGNETAEIAALEPPVMLPRCF